MCGAIGMMSEFYRTLTFLCSGSFQREYAMACQQATEQLYKHVQKDSIQSEKVTSKLLDAVCKHFAKIAAADHEVPWRNM